VYGKKIICILLRSEKVYSLSWQKPINPQFHGNNKSEGGDSRFARFVLGCKKVAATYTESKERQCNAYDLTECYLNILFYVKLSVLLFLEKIVIRKFLFYTLQNFFQCRFKKSARQPAEGECNNNKLTKSISWPLRRCRCLFLFAFPLVAFSFNSIAH